MRLARGSEGAGEPLWSAGVGGDHDGGLGRVLGLWGSALGLWGSVPGLWGSVLGLFLHTVAWIQLELRLKTGDFIIRGTSGKSSRAQDNK